MPLVSPTLGNPYPTVNAIMDVARARVNDMMNDTSGDLLSNDAPASQTYLTAAWHWYQDKCADAGVETLIKEIVLYGIPLSASTDTADQAHVTWMGCSDGVNQYETPALPQDLIQPLSVWRRQTGMEAVFNLMTQATDGLPTWFDYTVFDWRDDGMYYYACSYAQDFKIRYSAYRAELLLTQPDSLVPMMRCENCLGARIAFEFANPRGAAQAPAMEAWADKAFDEGAAQRTSRRKQRQSLRRIPYSRRGCGLPYPNIF